MWKFFSRTIGAEKFGMPVFVFLFLVFAGFGFFSVASENFSGKNIFQDADQDGLTDDEEALYGTDARKLDTDNDGYSDGAEVRSGYDPMKPAPGDRVLSRQQGENDAFIELTQNKSQLSLTEKNAASQTEASFKNIGGGDDLESGNLTKQVSEQIANILKKTSENGVDSTSSLQSIRENIYELLNDRGVSELTLPNVDEEGIKIKRQKYEDLSEEEKKKKIKEDTLEYVSKVSYILASNISGPLTSSEDLNAISEEMMVGIVSSIDGGDSRYLKDLIKRGDQALLELYEVSVPENMLSSHKRAIQLFRYATFFPEELKPSDSDPLAHVVALSKIQGFLGLLSNFVKQVDSDMKKIGIEEIPLDL